MKEQPADELYLVPEGLASAGGTPTAVPALQQLLRTHWLWDAAVCAVQEVFSRALCEAAALNPDPESEGGGLLRPGQNCLASSCPCPSRLSHS